MDIVRLELADTAAVDEWIELFVESQRVEFPHDPRPSRRELVGGLRHPWPGWRSEWWIARAGGEIVGTAKLSLPYLDNLETATADVLVSVRHRRRGVGRALFEHLLARAKSEGRVRMIAEVREPLPGSPLSTGAEQWGSAPFSEAMGAKRALQEVRRRLDVENISAEQLSILERDAEAASEGYQLVRWTDRTPDDIINDIAYLEGRMSIDPPLGDLHWEPEAVDAERIRRGEETMALRGARFYCTGARHEASGRVVGYTMYVLDGDVPEHAWQAATIVVHEHRGHRLGLRLKIANLALMRASEPALCTIDTWNAEENSHMIAVNEAMGFVPIELGSEWQLDL